MEDPYERAHQTEVDRNKKDKSLEAEHSFKINLHPKRTFNKDKKIFGTEVEFPEVFLFLVRKKLQTQSSIFLTMRTNGNQTTQINQDYRVTSQLFQFTCRTLQDK